MHTSDRLNKEFLSRGDNYILAKSLFAPLKTLFNLACDSWITQICKTEKQNIDHADVHKVISYSILTSR